MSQVYKSLLYGAHHFVNNENNFWFRHTQSIIYLIGLVVTLTHDSPPTLELDDDLELRPALEGTGNQMPAPR